MIPAKICGLSTAPTLQAALDGGAAYVGLVFFAKSPRNVSLNQAAALATLARGRAGIVALTVDASDDDLTAIVEHVSPDVLQLHGSESPTRVASVRARFGRRVWKAIPVATPTDAEQALAYTAADLILFDAKAPKESPLPGGNGHAFDWSALDGIKGRLPFMLSGGLTPENVIDAIHKTGACAVDVSSGVESSPGIKDAHLIRCFLEAVKASSTV